MEASDFSLEDALRATFREQVANPPATEALADRAVAAGRRIHARNAILSSVAAAVSVALVGIGVVSYIGGTGPVDPAVIAPPSLTAPASARPTTYPVSVNLPASVVIGDTLWVATADGGGQVPLAGLGTIQRAWRIDEGWLIESTKGADPSPHLLSYVPDSGSPISVVSGTAISVAGTAGTGDGLRVAWSTESELTFAKLLIEDGNVRLDELVTTPAPIVDGNVRLRPQALVGAAVVLAGGEQLEVWDAWIPAQGDYAASAGLPLVAPHGITADGERLIAWYQPDPKQPPCLGELEPDGLTPVPGRSRCPNPFARTDAVFPSPDGEYWMVIGEKTAAVYRAESVWKGGDPVVTVPEHLTSGTWAHDGAAFAGLTGDSVLQIYLDGLVVPEPLPSPTGVPVIVADLRA